MGAAPSRETCTPASEFCGNGSAFTARAITSATARPDWARPSRFGLGRLAYGTKPMPILLRSVCSAPIGAPTWAGTSHLLCGPPGPLNEPRSSMSHGPEPARWYGVAYGLLLLSP